MKTQLLLTTILAFSTLFCQAAERTLVSAADIRSIARGAGVENVDQNSDPVEVIVFAESHADRLGQLKQALILSKLVDLGLRHIGVEGLITDALDSARRPSWLGELKHPDTIVELATAHLRAGEINSTEYISLIHKNVVLIPVERKQDYDRFEGSDKAFSLCREKLRKLIAEHPSPEFRSKVAEVFESHAKSLRVDPKIDIEGILSDVAKKLGVLYASGLEQMTTDPRLKEAAKILDAIENRDKPSDYSIETEIELISLVSKLSVERGAAFSEQEASILNRFVLFLRNRHEASFSMVKSIDAAIRKDGIKQVALVIGAGHANQVKKSLRDAGRRFILLDTSHSGDSTVSIEDLQQVADYAAKMRRLSVDRSALGDLLREVYPPSDDSEILKSRAERKRGKIKPPLVIEEEWFRAKSECYLLVDTVARWNFNAQRQPLQLPSTKLVTVDLSSIQEFVQGGERVTQFKLSFRKDGEIKKELWVKCAKAENRIASVDAETRAEALLKKAIREVSESREVSKKEGLDDIAKRIRVRAQSRISEEVIAIFSFSKERLTSTLFSK